MANSAEAEDPSQHAEAGTATPARRKHETADAFGVPPLVKYTRRTELTEELRRWYALNETARFDELQHAALGEKRWSIETLLHAARQAWAAVDRRTYIKAFNAFVTRATPLLLSQAVKYGAGEQEDHAQEVLLITAEEVQAGNAEYAEAYFADYAMRKAISAHRRTDSRLESKLKRAEPRKPKTEEDGNSLDPLDAVAVSMPSPEVRALLRHAVGKLEGDLRDVFIMRHVHGLTYREIAEHYDVDESTIPNWVEGAEKLIGHQGGNDDHED
jgi:RNA polymerase sigma factor (sigma-70 family)